VYPLEESLVSEKILLPVGNYLITAVYLMTKENTVLLASPQKDLPLAQKITHSLPLAFTVSNQNISSQPATIELEVIPTDGWSPEDFGLDSSIITFREVYHVFVALVKKIGEMEFLPGQLIISSGDYTYVQELKEEITKVSFLSEYRSYKIKVESEGYRTYEKTLTLDSLKTYEDNPLLIALEKLDKEYVGGTFVGDLFLTTRMDAINFCKKGYTKIEGSLRMGLYPTDYITDLSPLSSLDSITGHLEIKANLALTTLKGLDNLKYIGGDVQIDDNPLLSSITLNNLTHIGRGLRIDNNDKLKDLNGLGKLASVGNIYGEDKNYLLSIVNNKSLKNYCSLNSLFTKGTYYQVKIHSNRYNVGEKEMVEGRCSI
jgi:hypothetical protein